MTRVKIWPETLALAGVGKMGGAMLEGWLAGGLKPSGVRLIEPKPTAEIEALAKRRRLAFNSPSGSAGPPEVLVLAIKPQMLDSAAPQLAALAGPDTLVLSIVAGKRIEDLAARFPQARAFVRAMPNTPAAIGRGATGAAANAHTTERQRRMTETLLGAIGAFHWLESEGLVDAVTALSGSGPAYVFALTEAMAEAGARLGLPTDLAMSLARATVEGAGELMFRQPETSPGQLRQNVTSPGGTTAAALGVLQAPDGLAALMARAIEAAHARAGELAG
jgi:pyrroline-5-carboxylate reductase